MLLERYDELDVPLQDEKHQSRKTAMMVSPIAIRTFVSFGPLPLSLLMGPSSQASFEYHLNQIITYIEWKHNTFKLSLAGLSVKGDPMAQADVLKKTGLRIKSLRMEQRLTQERLANDIGMAQSYLAEVENGKRNVSLVNIARIARGLGVQLSELFDGISLNGEE